MPCGAKAFSGRMKNLRLYHTFCMFCYTIVFSFIHVRRKAATY